MKFKKCFIDGQGNIWKESTLIKAAEDLPIESFMVSAIHFESVLRWKIVNLRDYTVHYKRVRDADLSVPIILNENGYPMDGWHRIIKACVGGQDVLPSKRFIKDPKPDFENV